jgi:hypothetical protein
MYSSRSVFLVLQRPRREAALSGSPSVLFFTHSVSLSPSLPLSLSPSLSESFLSRSLSLSTLLFGAEMTLLERGACADLDPARCKTCPSTPGRMCQQRPRRRAFYCPAQAIALIHVRTRSAHECSRAHPPKKCPHLPRLGVGSRSSAGNRLWFGIGVSDQGFTSHAPM